MGKSRSKRQADPSPALLVRGVRALGVTVSPGLAGLLGWAQVFLVALALAWLTWSFVVIRMTVPTGSMEPTIRVGTSFFVDKVSYRFRDPQPGDIIVFWNQEGGRRERLVKRLIAVGGQTVQVKGCHKYAPADCGVYVNGEKLTGPAFDRPYYAAGTMQDQVWTVPPGHFFVLGDNSQISNDSRYWGFAAREDFIGEPFLRVWPFEQFGFMNGYFGSPP